MEKEIKRNQYLKNEIKSHLPITYILASLIKRTICIPSVAFVSRGIIHGKF